MPQGGIDPGEDPYAAALRELYEETSVRTVRLLAEAPDWYSYDLPSIVAGRAWRGRYRGQTQRWFAFRFEGEEAEINILQPGGGRHKPEFDEWRWEANGAPAGTDHSLQARRSTRMSSAPSAISPARLTDGRPGPLSRRCGKAVSFARRRGDGDRPAVRAERHARLPRDHSELGRSDAARDLPALAPRTRLDARRRRRDHRACLFLDPARPRLLRVAPAGHDLQLDFWCFAIFILACGTTHFFSIWTLWNPDYGVEAIVKVLTAAASIATAIALWPLLPRALALPSPHELGQANEALVGRIRERDAALKALEVETAERLKAEEMLRQSQKMEAVGQLTGGVAHDFNNLLTVVVANLERIERRTRASDTEVRHAIESAMDGAERAAALTQQLLAFARKQPLRPVAVDVNALVADLSELLKRTLGERIVLDTALDPAVGPIAVDRNQMENALLNLTVNARDAMPEGGRLTIRTRPLAAAERERLTEIGGGPAIVIEVADTGTGMAPDVAERVFEPFFTTKPVGRGTGLGLSQVYGFVKQSKGHLDLTTRPGAGTSVRIVLPLATEDAASLALVSAL